MIRSFSLILILFILVSCKNNRKTTLDGHSAIIKHDRYYSRKYETYIPNKEDINRGLSLFKNSIIESDYFFKDSPDILDSVYKQYFGYFEEQDKILLINCLCELWDFPEAKNEFNSKLVIPDDGGICYFRAYINLDKNTVNLIVNGE
ncbi:hypothetical protein C9994_10445 [Marivirga lumbricoides]|uniref:Lipoprotein n=1 Tax=Marivirga lumbricoides TaxID=1046115 RepID=A0A2T4DPK3_9BACT|nr:hypothetical protein C9994_10445 [Marivirga lumbricoides]